MLSLSLDSSLAQANEEFETRESESLLWTNRKQGKKWATTPVKVTLAAVVVVVVVVSVMRTNSSSAVGEKALIAKAIDKIRADHNHANWAYGAENGPSKWASLSASYGTCGSGKKQSPINIKTFQVPHRPQGPELEFSYNEVENGEMQNNHHTVNVLFPGVSNSVTLRGSKYALAQFHFHHPAEHTINGRRADAEVHFVHVNAQGKIVVVGMLADLARGRGVYKAKKGLIEEMVVKTGVFPKDGDDTTFTLDDPLDLYDSLRRSSKSSDSSIDAYSYFGSLTTPPCTEAVNWFVLKQKFTLTSKALDILKASFVANTRPTQPLNGRRVLRSKLEEE